MLIDTRKEQENEEGFKPNVQNQAVKSNASAGGKFGYYFLMFVAWLIIIPGIIMLVLNIKTKNRINSSQMEINNAASNIDVQLAKRADLLQQLQEEAIAYLRHEGKVLQNVTALRSNSMKDSSTAIDKQEIVNNLQRNIDITFENYPNLKGIQTIQNLMSQSSILAYEIAAAQRTYNNRATQFNTEIVTWPTNVIINNMNVYSFPLFQASTEQKKSPDLSRLSHINYDK